MKMELSLWNDNATRRAILDFVKKVTDTGSPGYVPEEERVAVFDNDGTLWCERPLVQAGFIMEKMAAIVEKDRSLRETQPWQSAYQKDDTWINEVIVRHYRGDDSLVGILLSGILKSFNDMTLEAYNEDVAEYFKRSVHPKYKRPYLDVAYQPMVELLRYLEAEGFTTLIVSGGGRDFMRVISQQVFGVPPERVIGSSPALTFRRDAGGVHIWRTAEAGVLDDGPAKPVHIWNRTGRRPIVAAGNADGDIPMFQYAESSSRPSLCLLVNHDDTDREASYTRGAEEALELANRNKWTSISMKQDWRSIFGFDKR